MRKLRKQIAAMPLRWKGDKVQVLMVTSRDTGRWVVPKGWTMKGVKPWNAAAIEALEEAGVEGHISKDVFGTYQYDKVLNNGDSVPVVVDVYPMVVETMQKTWKERDERVREWFYVEDAATKVDEPELSELLEKLVERPKKVPVVGPILKKIAS